MMKKKILLSLLGIFLGFLLFATWKGYDIYKEYNNSVTKEGEQVEVNIEKGASIKQIVVVLKEKGLIQYEYAFLWKVKQMNYGSKLRYGTFLLHKGMCIEDILNTLSSKGIDKEKIKVVIPEGYSVELIAKRLEEKGICSEVEFLNAANSLEYDFSFLKQLKIKDGVTYQLQGFLFPATYEFYPDSDASFIVETMLHTFVKYVGEDRIEQMAQEGQDLYEIVTIASMIEREARVEEERPMIAGVIYNRLKENMRLQIDPTVLYPLTNGLYNAKRVLYKDLEIESPYNTYRNHGLPLGPICSPGLSAIEGALNPAKHEYLFYHTDGSPEGRHIFTKTFEEHKETMK